MIASNDLDTDWQPLGIEAGRRRKRWRARFERQVFAIVSL
jgi:hypothetical protein